MRRAALVCSCLLALFLVDLFDNSSVSLAHRLVSPLGVQTTRALAGAASEDLVDLLLVGHHVLVVLGLSLASLFRFVVFAVLFNLVSLRSNPDFQLARLSLECAGRHLVLAKLLVKLVFLLLLSDVDRLLPNLDQFRQRGHVVLRKHRPVRVVGERL